MLRIFGRCIPIRLLLVPLALLLVASTPFLAMPRVPLAIHFERLSAEDLTLWNALALVGAVATLGTVGWAGYRWRRLMAGARRVPRRVMVLSAGRADPAAAGMPGAQAVAGYDVVAQVPAAMRVPRAQPVVVPAVDEPLPLVVQRYGIEEIVIATGERNLDALPLAELIECRLRGVAVTELAAFHEREHGRVPLELLNAGWLFHGAGFRRGRARVAVKRLFDLGVSAALLVVSLPITLLVAAAILIEDGRPVMYRQERVGQGGRRFQLYKFRSMRKDAEKDGKPRWARDHDERVTRTGRVLRRLHLDEVPQIYNVLRGEMSFVGPRPERPFFVEQLSAGIPYYRARHSIKPGITGWAQVHYRYCGCADDAVQKLQYDLYYIKNHTLLLDIAILIKTIRVVLSGRGAR